MVHLTNKDYWAELAIRHKDDIVQFLNHGAFSDNSVFSEFHKYYNENKQRSQCFFWKFKLDKNKHPDWAFTGVEVNNAINELRKIALDEESPLDVQTPIVHLCKATVSPVIARDVLMKTENNFRKILVTYFGLYPDLPEDKTPVFNELEERLSWLLIPFPDVQYPPISIIRYTRNKVHSERVNPKTRETEKDPQTGKILFNDQTLPDNPVLALQVVKFIVFSYVGTVAICRKFISKISKAHPDIESYITKDIICKYWKFRGQKDIPEDNFRPFELECSQKIRQWMDSILNSADKVLSQYDSTQKVTLKPHSHSEVLSVKWKVGEANWNDSPEMLVNQYEKIKAEVRVAEFNHKFIFESLITAEHTGNITLVLDCELNEARVECDMVDDEVLDIDQNLDLDTVSLKLLTDLDCDLEIRGVTPVKVARRWETTELQVPKGIHTITLTAKNNPSYVMTRDVDMTEDIVINDMLFAKEVYNHREWWDIENIVILKATFPREMNYFVLWDKTVNLPVYYCTCYDDKCETGFTGNLFYTKDNNGYSYYSLNGSKELPFLSEHLFTFTNGYEFTGYDGYGDALVIDEEGRTLFTIYRKTIKENYGYKQLEWGKGLRRNYASFIRQFKFSDNGLAAIIGEEGTSIRFVDENWKPVSDSYSYIPNNYPVFRNGYCAVKKGDEGYLFLKHLNGFIQEMSERYDYLMPMEIQRRWVYLVQKDGLYGILNPADTTDIEVIPIEYDRIDENALKYGIFCGGKGDQWMRLEWACIRELLPPPYDYKNIISNNFFLIGKQTDSGVICKHLCTRGKIIASDVIDYSRISDDLIAAKLSDGKWSVFDIEGNGHLKNYSEILTIYHPTYDCLFIRIKKDERWEVWKVDKSNLTQVAKPLYTGIPTCSASGFKFWDPEKKEDFADVGVNGGTAIKYAGQWVWENNTNIVLPPGTRLIRHKHPVLPFSKFSSPERIGLMERDTFSEIAAPVYQCIYRIGNIWVAEQEGTKTIFSDTGDLLAKDLRFDSIKEYSTDLYRAEKDGAICLINANGKRKSEFYSEIRPITHNFAAVKRYYWGFIIVSNEKVKEICSTDYFSVKDFTEDGYALVQENKDGGWGLINSEGKQVVKCTYDDIDPFRCDFTSARSHRWYIINKENNHVTFEFDNYKILPINIIVP